MLATRIQQKDSSFYFISYPAEDLLRKVRFISRFYADRDVLEENKPKELDDVAMFIANIERSDASFQRELSKRKVEAIKNFYETAISQPPIPGTVLLFTSENLSFSPLGNTPNVGNLDEPKNKFLIIDGQHRLAALHFYIKSHPEESRSIHVPCIIFDGKSEDFATEMFVVINSTPTRINKSHLIDLYEKVSWTSPDRKTAALVTDLLYRNDDSPLQYRINRLGGRSGQKKWILQAELFNEIHKWIADEGKVTDGRQVRSAVTEYYEQIRDFFKACEKVWGPAWGNDKYMITGGVCLKAMVRVCADLSRNLVHEEGRERVWKWKEEIKGWERLIPEFRKEGFYERFVAKGQVERVKTVHRKLMEGRK
ncbi:MAG: DGQHR domain-containing protein [Bacteroidia bacterium]|nr:DGQHR domain-containing protein [Bacteroidia bacterium]